MQLTQTGVLMWVQLVLALAVLGALFITAWFGCLVGTSPVLSPRQARDRLRAVVDSATGADPTADVRGTTGVERPVGSGGTPVDTGATASSTRGAAKGNRDALLDAAVPGGLAFVAGGFEWLTPDQAAIDAVEHVTREQIGNAFDLHASLADHQYRLLTDGSMWQWRGHVGEAQVAEQIESWFGPGTVDMPEASNFAGADMTIFNHDFQVKFGEDFRSIDNIHGDPLIVPDGTANVPDDALRLDLSEPFDPSVLDGHDVVVAEGLTLAGAENAWESAAGAFAGGLDAGDAGDVAEFSMIPGLGAAVRVAMSGYRRRAALADPELRTRAMGRVARDAGYGVTGAGGGAAAGGLVGGLVDVATMGMTLGAGAWVGGTIGAMIGGRTAGHAARAEDEVKLEKQRSRVNDALLEYGQAVEDAEASAKQEWEAALSDAEARAEELEAIRRRELTAVVERAGWELAKLRQLSDDEARILLDDAAASVERAGARTPRGRRLAARWVAKRDELWACLSRSDTVDAEQVLLLSIAAPDGEELVTTWLIDRVARRATVLASAEALLATVRWYAAQDRTTLADELTTTRREIQTSITEHLADPIRKVERRTASLKKELLLNGNRASG